jgi:DNA-binding CsgD family transcriptional regulator
MAGKKQLNLTQGQKDCLRLVDDLLTSKEIARELGISPFTVDQRLDAARRKLNAPSRKMAARMYLEIETDSLPESIVYDPADIADFDFMAMLTPENSGEALRSVKESETKRLGPIVGVRQPAMQSKSYAGVLRALLETGLICVIMVSAMILILTGLLRTLN